MKVKTFTKRDIATEIADRLDATVVDSLMFRDVFNNTCSAMEREYERSWKAKSKATILIKWEHY